MAMIACCRKVGQKEAKDMFRTYVDLGLVYIAIGADGDDVARAPVHSGGPGDAKHVHAHVQAGREGTCHLLYGERGGGNCHVNGNHCVRRESPSQ